MYKNHHMLFIVLLTLNATFWGCQPAQSQKQEKPALETNVDLNTPEVSTAELTIEETVTPADKTIISEPVKKSMSTAATTVETVTTEKMAPAAPTTIVKEEIPLEKPTEMTKEPAQKTTTPQTTAPIKKEVPVEVTPTEVAVENETVSTSAVAEGHSTFDDLLKTYVKNGKVNYKGIKADEAKLDGYLTYLKGNAPSTSDTSPGALAFWMNAYNAFTIKLILDNYPTPSIMKLYGGKAWDQEWIDLGGKTYSLNQIEHDIIRPVFNDARIHFAVVCAAKSCQIGRAHV